MPADLDTDLFGRLAAAAADDWERYVGHAFVERIGDGSLPEAAFRHYLIQDYLFLIHFARAYALAIYKSPSLADMRAAHGGLKAILDVEMDLHVGLLATWGISVADLEPAAEAPATMAYTRYVLDTGMRGDLLDLHVALAPCVIGYAEIGRRLAGRALASAEANPYRSWIAEYSGDAYQQVAAQARATLDRCARRSLPERRFPEVLTIFRQACRLETAFWDMAMTPMVT